MRVFVCVCLCGFHKTHVHLSPLPHLPGRFAVRIKKKGEKRVLFRDSTHPSDVLFRASPFPDSLDSTCCTMHSVSVSLFLSLSCADAMHALRKTAPSGGPSEPYHNPSEPNHQLSLPSPSFSPLSLSLSLCLFPNFNTSFSQG